jgi:hypothetical protein
MTDNQLSLELAQLGDQFRNAAMDKLDPAVIAGKSVQDFIVENKDAKTISLCFRGAVKRCVVDAAEVPVFNLYTL